jgi:signal transduction histidine kinase
LVDKMFTTRFTTNSTEASTGLGLTICAQIVRQHSGEISIDRKSPNTTILIELPLTSSVAQNAA